MPNKENNIISFFDLLQSENRIEIPIIQRDYVQGRKDKSDLRTNFLSTLFDSLNNNKPIQLDFIYGSKVEKSFQPLDGQQRLTTLFLLHWYAAAKEGYLKNNFDTLNKFSYETRITSREFCNSLLKNDITIDVDSTSSLISEYIRDSKWYFLSWDKDPTIDSMLRTIDDIHSKFYMLNNLWDKLINNKLISFYYVELEDIGLTDDLYIKMNARGKLLSSFENFKACFEKNIEEHGWETNVNQFDTFAFKIDTDWTDFFWSKFQKNNNIDEAFMKFISTLLMIRLSIERGTNRINLISSLQEDFNQLRSDLISKDTYKYIYDCFEIYLNQDEIEKFEFSFPFWRHQPIKFFLNEIVYEEKNASYTQKVLFYAQTEYLLRNSEFNKEKFDNWMRVVRNIISRGSVEKGGKRPDIIRSPETFDGVINLIQELSTGSENIYKYLSNIGKLNSTFARYQTEEERIKSTLINQSNYIKDCIFKMEDLDLFKGRIGFVLYCLDYNEDHDNFDLDLFNKIYNVILEHFNDGNSDKISNNIRRALLTIENDGIYEFYGYWKSYWYVEDANKRCLIENFRELEYYMYYTEYDIYLKKLILELTNKNVEDIINDFILPNNMPNWKIRLIKEANLLDEKSKSNYIAISLDNLSCYLLKSKRPRDIDGCYIIK